VITSQGAGLKRSDILSLYEGDNFSGMKYYHFIKKVISCEQNVTDLLKM